MIELDYQVYIPSLHKIKSVIELNLEHQTVTVYVEEKKKETYPLADVSLMVYTGVQDKKGKRIYSGQIVWVDHFLTELVPTYKAVIEWHKGRFIARTIEPIQTTYLGTFDDYSVLDTLGTTYEVIGDRYLNKEMVGNKE